jgi:hypothetical protein
VPHLSPDPPRTCKVLVALGCICSFRLHMYLNQKVVSYSNLTRCFEVSVQACLFPSMLLTLPAYTFCTAADTRSRQRAPRCCFAICCKTDLGAEVLCSSSYYIFAALIACMCTV